MKINRFIGVLLVLCVTLTLVGCAKNNQEVTKLTTMPVTEVTVPTDTTAATKDNSFKPEQEFEVTKAQLSDFMDDWVEQCAVPEGPNRNPLCRITVTGMCTPVELQLEGAIVRNLLAYGRTLKVDAYTPEGLTEFSLSEHEDMLIVSKESECWLMVPEENFYFPCTNEVSTYLYTNNDGQLAYGKYAVAINYMDQAVAIDYMDQYFTLPLDSATDRGNLYTERGIVEFQEGKPVLVMQERTLMGHVYDFDAIFAMARVLDWEDYPGCENADDVLRRNKAADDDWLTYPYEPLEPAQRVNFEGLTLALPAIFDEELQEDGSLILRGTDYVHADVVLKVTTGKTADGYQGVKGPITTPQQMSDWDAAHSDDLTAADFTLRGVQCLYVYGNGVSKIRGYYVKDNRWWVIEVADIWEDKLPTYAACGTFEE